jgi:hypothetical protein
MGSFADDLSVTVNSPSTFDLSERRRGGEAERRLRGCLGWLNHRSL